MCRYVTYTNASSETLFISEEHSLYGSARIGVDGRKDTLYKAGAYNPACCGTQSARRELGHKQYELTNHLGNVLVSLNDKKAYKTLSGSICFEAEIITLSDYYPFGSAMQTRGFAAVGYRFGFNGQERDGELGEAYAFEYRIHDARLGRFMSVDPLRDQYPWNSNYAFAENDVIRSIDLEGAEKFVVVHCWEPSLDGNNRYSKYNGTAFLYLPDLDDVRLIRNPKNPYYNMTMTIHKELKAEQMAPLGGDIFTRSAIGKKEIDGLSDAVKNIIFSTTGTTKGQLVGSIWTPSSVNNYENLELANVERLFNMGIFMKNISEPRIKTLYYEHDKVNTDALNPDYIRSIQSFLQRNPGYVINVTGHTDRTGTSDYNYDLGMRRAENVRDKLVNLGIDKNRIRTLSRGELDAKVSEDQSVEKRASDRKVEVNWSPRPPQ